jgi:hypothetical protein
LLGGNSCCALEQLQGHNVFSNVRQFRAALLGLVHLLLSSHGTVAVAMWLQSSLMTWQPLRSSSSLLCHWWATLATLSMVKDMVTKETVQGLISVLHSHN